jgi:hypothetical protein
MLVCVMLLAVIRSFKSESEMKKYWANRVDMYDLHPQVRPLLSLGYPLQPIAMRPLLDPCPHAVPCLLRRRVLPTGFLWFLGCGQPQCPWAASPERLAVCRSFAWLLLAFSLPLSLILCHLVFVSSLFVVFHSISLIQSLSHTLKRTMHTRDAPTLIRVSVSSCQHSVPELRDAPAPGLRQLTQGHKNLAAVRSRGSWRRV